MKKHIKPSIITFVSLIPVIAAYVSLIPVAAAYVLLFLDLKIYITTIIMFVLTAGLYLYSFFWLSCFQPKPVITPLIGIFNAAFLLIQGYDAASGKSIFGIYYFIILTAILSFAVSVFLIYRFYDKKYNVSASNEKLVKNTKTFYIDGAVTAVPAIGLCVYSFIKLPEGTMTPINLAFAVLLIPVLYSLLAYLYNSPIVSGILAVLNIPVYLLFESGYLEVNTISVVVMVNAVIALLFVFASISYDKSLLADKKEV